MRHAVDVKLDGVICGAKAVVLHPSLRAAAYLERRYGFQTLLKACGECNLTVITDVIEASSDCPDFLATLATVPLSMVMPGILEKLPAHILALAGVDPSNPAQEGGETISFADNFKRLYRIGTGWLGWSPETTWNATSSEITDAYSGHIEMLRAIHGGSEDETTRPTEKPQDAKFDRAGFSKLRGLGTVS
ncbi:MAG TPA: hypothetical protein VMV59_08845 [Candidatus Dormibacteraeota bacterium]|nr:hypothetical protein [Candidatus Dormibacteraeota bacterium]